LRDWVLEQELLEWRWLEHLEDFVRTGHNAQAHDGLAGDAWGVYQRGMRSVAGLSSAEVARRVPEGARQMLDLGGSHGYYSVIVCRRHPGLPSVALDLPQAICHAAPLPAQEGMGDRVVQRAGDATTDDFGTAAFDLVFIANVVHHFDVPPNRDLARRAAHALRPVRFFVILDFVRPRSPKDARQVGTLNDLFFALSSAGSLHPLARRGPVRTQLWRRPNLGPAGLAELNVWVHSRATPAFSSTATTRPAAGRRPRPAPRPGPQPRAARRVSGPAPRLHQPPPARPHHRTPAQRQPRHLTSTRAGEQT
jgi:SAM-dependent methyltransferase